MARQHGDDHSECTLIMASRSDELTQSGEREQFDCQVTTKMRWPRVQMLQHLKNVVCFILFDFFQDS